MKRVQTIALIFGTILALVASSAVVLPIVFEDKVKQKIVSEINNQLTVPVEVKGGIKLSLFSHFPYASLTFSQVSIGDKLRKGNAKLIEVQEVSFLCNVLSLFGDEIEFSKAVVSNGQFNLYKNASGQTNFDIFKESKPEPGKPASKLSIQLKAAEVKDVKFTYLDEVQAVDIKLNINDSKLKGNFSDAKFELETEAGLYVNKLFASGEDYIKERNVKADVVLIIDKASKRYDFKKGKLKIEECDFDITGFFALLEQGTQLDFKLVNEGKDVQQLVSLLPVGMKQAAAKADGKGEYAVTAAIKGLVSKTTNPKVNITANLKNCDVKLGKYNKQLQKVNAYASYDVDEKGNNKLVIKDFKCMFQGQPFNFGLTIVHFADPSFDFYAHGVMELSEFSGFIPDTILKGLDGTVAFNNFHLRGRQRDFTDVINSTLTGSGDFRLKDVQFTSSGVTYNNINGLLGYENRVIHAQDFTLNFLGSDFNFSGTIENLFAFVYNLDAKRKRDDIVLGVNGRVQIKTFDLNKVLNGYTQQNKVQEAPADGSRMTVRDVLSMRGNLDVAINKFLVRKMEFDAIQSNLQIVPGMIRINSLSTHTMDGDVRAQAILYFTQQNSLRAKCDISAIDLDIPTIFRQCESFGQNSLTEKNLKGTVNTSVSFDAEWLNYTEINQKTLSALVDFKIKNGELMNFEPLHAASKFIRVQELNDIRFADLSNTIKIANGQIAIPEFEIKNSALNMMFSGYHYFNNTIDYHLKINLHKLLAGKFKRKIEDDSKYIESDPYEGLNIFLSMTGDINNPKIQYDKASARKKMQTDIAQGKKELHNLFKDAPLTDAKERKREDKYFQVKEEPSFMDFDTSGN